MTESSIDLRFPELERVVGPWYSKTQAALDGMPPHVTLLYPWLSIPTDDAIDRVAVLLHEYTPFTVVFERIERFDDVALYVRPQSDGVIESMMFSLWRAFPETPPYGGAHGVFPEPIPHLTVTQGLNNHLDEVEAALTPLLASPIRCQVGAVFVGQEALAPDGRWGVRRTIEL